MTAGPQMPSAKVDWSIALASQDHEYQVPIDVPTSGVLPPGLVGTLFLVGPARHDLHGSRGASWLDGDGMVHALRLAPARAAYQRRFVETERKRAEDRAGRRLYATFASTAPGGPVARLLRARPRSPANGGVAFHQGRLFALWDGAPPYGLDPVSLETRGPYRLDGLLRRGDGFATSPAVDAVTGELWNVGGRLRGVLRLGVYRWPPHGRPRLVASARPPYASIVRSVALTGTKAVFMLSPLVLRLSAAGMLGRRSAAEMLTWRPELGSFVALVDRASGRFRFHRVPPMLVSAVAQAYDEGDDVVVDVCTYPDTSILGATRDMMRGALTSRGYATLERLVVRARGRVERTLLPPLDWPCLAAPARPGPDARIFGMNLNPVAGFPGTLAAVDVGTGAVQWVPPLPHEVAGPPTAVAKAGAVDGRQAWVLAAVTDLVAKRSELRVYDGERLLAPPVYRAELPRVMPFGARGVWAPGV
jgi:all-trans-8'-apo-beta-carotenal 15,15'-oxygenase